MTAASAVASPKDLYDVLGVHRTAPTASVRSAFHRRALATHPDKGGSSLAFRAVVGAYEVLSDSTLRTKYDWQLLESGSRDGLSAPRENTNNEGAGTRTERSSQACTHPRGCSPGAAMPTAEARGGHPKELSESAERLLEELLQAQEDSWDSALGTASMALLQALLARVAQRRKSTTSSGQAQRDKAEDFADECQHLAISAQASEDGEETVDAGGKEPPLKRPKVTANIRGIFSRCGKGYGCATFCGPFVMASPQLKALDKAIEFHQHLLRIKQLARSSGLSSGDVQLGDVLRVAIEQLSNERTAAGFQPLKLSYYVSLSIGRNNLASPSTQDLGTALAFLSTLQQIRTMPDRAQRWAEARVQMVAEVQAERKRRSQQRRQAVRALLRVAKAAKRRIKRIVDEEQRTKRAHMRKCWGVPQLPQGIEEAAMPEGTGQPGVLYACAVLPLTDGSAVRGPPRAWLEDALGDLRELEGLQAREGDAAMLAEMAQREAEVMAKAFMEQLGPPAGATERPRRRRSGEAFDRRRRRCRATDF